MICRKCNANKTRRNTDLCATCTDALYRKMYDTFDFTGDLIWDLAMIQSELSPADSIGEDEIYWYQFLLFGKSKFVNAFKESGLLKIWEISRATIAM